MQKGHFVRHSGSRLEMSFTAYCRRNLFRTLGNVIRESAFRQLYCKKIQVMKVPSSLLTRLQDVFNHSRQTTFL